MGQRVAVLETDIYPGTFQNTPHLCCVRRRVQRTFLRGIDPAGRCLDLFLSLVTGLIICNCIQNLNASRDSFYNYALPFFPSQGSELVGWDNYTHRTSGKPSNFSYIVFWSHILLFSLYIFTLNYIDICIIIILSIIAFCNQLSPIFIG